MYLLRVSLPVLLVLGSALLTCEPAKAQDKADAKKVREAAILSGRIVDDTGAPVTDAHLTLAGPGYFRTTTDDDGRYRFTELKKPGEYRIQIKSVGWIGLHDYRKQPRLDLTPTSEVTRNFTLERAGQLEIRAVDEDGIPIRGVSINVASLAEDKHRNTDSVRTDVDGWATVGGLQPSNVKYIFGLRHKNYAFAKLIDAVKKPGVGDSQTVVMKKGVTVKGSAICSDGKPPTGWKVLAMPKWWHFGVSPIGSEVAKDGTFEFLHIVPGEYDVTISIPQGGGSSQSRRVMTGDLLALPQPPSLKIDSPSPASMTSISGTIVFSGERPNGFWLHARSTEGNQSASVYVRGDETKFKLEPIPKGRYNITANAAGVESLDLKNVVAPTTDLEIKLKGQSKSVLAGRVVLPDGKTPVETFQMSVIKIWTLGGPNYVEDARWKNVQAKDGKFSVEVNGAGIYVVAALADGFAPTKSVEINTTLKQQTPVEIVLDKGVSLSGTVVDETGKPIVAAKVQAMSLAAKGSRGPTMDSLSDVGAVITDREGRFRFPNLPRAKEWLRVSSKGFCDTNVENLDLANRPDEPLTIVMNTGVTIRGLVFDGTGNPASGVVLHFQDAFHGGDYERGRLGSAVTDSRGFYKVDHLPFQQVYITCGDEWNGIGVVRRAILPQKEKRITVHFGGPEKLTGTIKVNGNPLADTRILLAGKSSFSTITKAFAKTDTNGNFTFFGAPPGIWTLYHDSGNQRSSDWIPIRDIEVEASASMDLGEMNYRSGSLTINCVPADPAALAGLRLSLSEYDPVWAFGQSVGVLRPRKAPSEPFVFDQVPSGDFELVCRGQGSLVTRQRLQVSAAKLPQTIDFALPQGSGTLDGSVPIPDERRVQRLNLWSEDGRWHTSVRVDKEGKFAVANLPAGKWVIRDRDTRTWPPVYTFELKAGERKTIKLTAEHGLNRASPSGFGKITACTSNGVVTPCRITLSGPGGELSVHSSQHGRVTFTGPPGEYDATIRLKGFTTQKRKVVLRRTNAAGRPAEGWSTTVILEAE